MSSPERLAYWYLRLNGYLLLENFILHDETSADQRTDADLVGVRLKYRRENYITPMQDDDELVVTDKLIDLVVVEVKKGICDINKSWSQEDKENVHRVLRAIGCFKEEEIRLAANQIYKTGCYLSDQIRCRLIAVGERYGELPINGVHQILYSHMLRFIHRRFSEYKLQKSSVGNWSPDGQRLRSLADQDFATFEHEVRRCFDLRQITQLANALEQTESQEHI